MAKGDWAEEQRKRLEALCELADRGEQRGPTAYTAAPVNPELVKRVCGFVEGVDADADQRLSKSMPIAEAVEGSADAADPVKIEIREGLAGGARRRCGY